MFTDGRGSTEVAKELRVSVRSVQRRRRASGEAGQEAVRSRGPASRPKLSDGLFAVHEEKWPKAQSRTAGQISGGRWPGSRR
ncbi:hypothetical protein [Streptomyces goshikiensis]|uniref:hypothetical protein n=1 Tax=Streptomyces goshikiensis TaxID=1942 RepID=UPI00371DE918